LAEKRGMKGFVLLLLLACFGWAAPPLQVAAVGRVGLPPYEGTERLYRLEGLGCQTLRVGESLLLQRPGDLRRLGRLEVLAVHLDHAQARLSLPGDTFPLKGDLAIRTEELHALPDLPGRAPQPLPVPSELCARTVTLTLPRSLGQGPSHREPIYFLKGDGSLSPGALVKLRAWVEAWGAEGQWSLECPPASSGLAELRLSALRAELQRLGVPRLEALFLSEGPQGPYDAIFVKKEPW